MTNKSLVVCTAGLSAVPGQRAHPIAVFKAKSLGIDLTTHVSTVVTAEIVARPDIIFVMVIAHLLLMRKRLPGVRRKTFLLGGLAKESPLDILDPFPAMTPY